MTNLRYITTVVAVLSLLVSTQAQADITFMDAQQEVAALVGYKVEPVDVPIAFNSDSHGFGDATLEAIVNAVDPRTTGKAYLTSSFDPSPVHADGSASAIAKWWKETPSGVQDVHVGARSSFIVQFQTGFYPVLMDITGSLGVEITSGPHPEEVFASARLYSETTVLWEEELVGPPTYTIIPVSQSLLLLAGQTYWFEAYAEAGAVATPSVNESDRDAYYKLILSTSTPKVPVPGAVLLGVLGLGSAGLKLRKYA